MRRKFFSIWTIALLIILGLACYAAPRAKNSVKDIKVEELAGKIRVTITTTEPANYLLSKIYQPPQLIVDITNAVNDLPKKRFRVGKGVLDQIRSSQYKRVPIEVVRVVMDVSKWVRHDIARKGNQLYVDFYQPELLVAEEEILPVLPALPPEKVEVVPEVKEEILPPEEAIAPEEAIPTPEEQLISLDLKDANMGYVLKFLAEMSEFNIVASEEVTKGKVTMYLMDVPFMTALDMILKTQGLWYKIEENIIRVMTLDEFMASLEAKAELTRVFRLQYADAETLANTLNDLLGAVKRKEVTKVRYDYEVKRAELEFIGETRVIPDVRSNSLIVTTDRPQNFVLLEKLIKNLDNPVPQVLIEAMIMDITLTDEDKFGVWWRWWDATSEVRFDDGAVGEGLTYTSLGEFKAYISREHIQTLVQAISIRNKVNVLSSPTILTLDNQEAEIFVGYEWPFLTERKWEEDRWVETYEYRDVGIRLTVTPQINIEKAVNMTVKQEVMKYAGRDPLSDLPYFIKREAAASLLAEDGQTIVIGGIIREESTDEIKKVPFLGDIPILGYLFKRSNLETLKTELMIFISPHVILTAKDARAVTKGQEEKLTVPPPPRGKIEGGE